MPPISALPPQPRCAHLQDLRLRKPGHEQQDELGVQLDQGQSRRIEAALDIGTISAPGVGKTDHIQELELEWLPRDAAMAPPVFRKFHGTCHVN